MKTKYSLLTLFFLVVMLSLTGCYYDNEEDLYLGNYCDTTTVTYADIAPIFAENCNLCHSGAEPVGFLVLDTYENVKANITRVKGAVNHETGFRKMPENGELPPCELLKINVWINHDTPQN